MNINRISRALLMVTLSMALAAGMWGVVPAQRVAAANCTSQTSGNWGDVSTWDCGQIPGAADDVIILETHQVTLTQNESVNNITINNAAERLTGAYTLEIYGTLSSSTTSPNANIISSSTLVKFVGSVDRALFGTWGATTTGLVFEVALNAGTTGTGANVKARSATITSGTLNLTGELRPDAGTTGSGVLYIASGATLRAVRLSRTSTANTPFESFTNYGTFRTSSSTTVWPDDTSCLFGAASTVDYIGSNQNIQTPLNSSYGHLVLSGSGTKTAPANLEIRGHFTNNNSLTAGTGTVIFNGTAEQAIGGSSVTAFNNLTVSSGATVVIPTTNIPTVAGTLTNNGTLKQTQDVNGSTDVNFFNVGGYGGLTINASGSDLGSTVVSIKGNQACDTDNTAIHRCFDIAPANATGRNATITFYYNSAELNSLVCAEMDAWHWSGALPWVQAGTSGTRQCATDPYSLQVSGVTTFSPFALRSGAAGPTSVGFVALGGSASLLPIGMLLLAGLVVLRKRK